MNRAHTAAAALVSALLLAVLAGPAAAQDRSLEEGPIVRRQLLFRSDRLELSPALAHTLNDPYRRTLLFNANLNYHLTNTFSLGLTAGWGFLNYNTNILDEMEAVNPAVARELEFADKTIMANIHFAYVPWYGKFNFLEATTIHYDFHLTLGFGGALLSSDNADLEGFKIGPAVGGGFRFFFDGDTALAIDIMDQMYSSADVARPGVPVEEEFGHTVTVQIGVSFFVTGELRVSR